MALGAMAGIAVLLKKAKEYDLPGDLRLSDWRKLDDVQIKRIFNWLWTGRKSRYEDQLIRLIQNAKRDLTNLIVISDQL